MIHWHYLAWAAAAVCFILALLAYFGAGMASRSLTREDFKFPRMCLLVGVILIVITLAACAKPGLPPPEPIIRTVEIAVPFDDPACARAALAEAEETRPDYPDTDEALANASGIFQAIQLYKAGRGLRIAYTKTLLDSLRECAR